MRFVDQNPSKCDILWSIWMPDVIMKAFHVQTVAWLKTWISPSGRIYIYILNAFLVHACMRFLPSACHFKVPWRISLKWVVFSACHRISDNRFLNNIYWTKLNTILIWRVVHSIRARSAIHDGNSSFCGPVSMLPKQLEQPPLRDGFPALRFAFLASVWSRLAWSSSQAI